MVAYASRGEVGSEDWVVQPGTCQRIDGGFSQLPLTRRKQKAGMCGALANLMRKYCQTASRAARHRQEVRSDVDT
jgi:hypothetical protein